MRLYEKHAAIRDKFEVLAFHDPRAKTFEELDEKLEPIIRERWDGKALPFPILLDATGETLKAFGISAFPTNVLIDPEGRVVKGNAEKNFKRKLEELAPPESEEPSREDEAVPEEGDSKDDEASDGR